VPASDDPAPAEERSRVTAWLSGLAVLVFLGLAAVAMLCGYRFFGVAAVVLAVFAAVELAWVLRTRRSRGAVRNAERPGQQRWPGRSNGEV
jgi:hypothetical protein